MKNKKGKSFLGMLLLLIAIGVFGYFGYSTMNQIKLGLDLAGGVSITYQAKEENPSSEDMADTIYKLQQRVQNYSTEAEVYQEGNNRINVDIPGVSDANAILEELGKPGSLIFVDSEGNQILDGKQVASAKAGMTEDKATGSKAYVVSLTFTEEGKQAFAEATTNGVGKPIYIIYDNQIISAPTVREAITGGQCQIDGMADYPVKSLNGKTPLEAAKTPNMDALAQTAQIGLVKTVPDGFKPGSDVANLGVLGFDAVPVDGSSKMADDLMESIEPFAMQDAVAFNTAYLAGYVADKYDVDAKKSIERANERIRQSTEDAFTQTVTGYDSVKVENSSIQLHGGKAKYALFPVWVLSTSWRGENYIFAMNGQTGKFVGNLPVDKAAARKWTLGLTAAVGAASYAVMWLLWLAGIL